MKNETILCFPVFNCPFLPRNFVLVTKRHLSPPRWLWTGKIKNGWGVFSWEIMRMQRLFNVTQQLQVRYKVYIYFLCSTKRREIISVRFAGVLTVWRNWIMLRQERGIALRRRRLPAGRRETRHQWRLQAEKIGRDQGKRPEMLHLMYGFNMDGAWKPEAPDRSTKQCRWIKFPS